MRKQQKVSPIVPDYVKHEKPPTQVVEMQIEAEAPPKNTQLENELRQTHNNAGQVICNAPIEE